MSTRVRCGGMARGNKNVRLAGGRWIVATWGVAGGEMVDETVTEAAGHVGGSVREQPDQDQHEGRYTQQPGEDIRHGFAPCRELHGFTIGSAGGAYCRDRSARLVGLGRPGVRGAAGIADGDRCAASMQARAHFRLIWARIPPASRLLPACFPPAFHLFSACCRRACAQSSSSSLSRKSRRIIQLRMASSQTFFSFWRSGSLSNSSKLTSAMPASVM